MAALPDFLLRQTQDHDSREGIYQQPLCFDTQTTGSKRLLGLQRRALCWLAIPASVSFAQEGCAGAVIPQCLFMNAKSPPNFGTYAWSELWRQV